VTPDVLLADQSAAWVAERTGQTVMKRPLMHDLQEIKRCPAEGKTLLERIANDTSSEENRRRWWTCHSSET